MIVGIVVKIFLVPLKKDAYSHIGPLKTNRVIFQKGHEKLEIKLHQFDK